MKIKIFPVIGDAYVIELPDCVTQSYDVDEAIEQWLYDHTRLVDTWKYM